MDAPQGSINLKPNKPEPYEGNRDYLVVNTWLYKVEQYLVLVQLCNPGVPLTEENKILYASTFLTSTAAVWWYTLVQANTVPATWQEFKAKVIAEFVPDDHMWDKFCSGLKYDVRIEVMKSTVSTFDEAAKVALRVDSAIWGASHLQAASISQAPTPMM
eukprot:IDg18338t1